MTAIVSGSSLGLELTSLGTLGPSGTFGPAHQGRTAERSYVNVATGNLVLQNRDTLIIARGLDVESVRTYNSLGRFEGDTDNWLVGVEAQCLRVVGAWGAEDSTLIRTARDGAQSTYTWNVDQSRYMSTDGDGAHDAVEMIDGALAMWIDGSTGSSERYDLASGRLVSCADSFGNVLSYAYDTDGHLTAVVGANGESTTYTYEGDRLLGIATRTVEGGIAATTTLVRYAYDELGRLASVEVDLSPADGSTTDGRVYATRYTYDGDSRRLATLVQADGSSLAFTYDDVAGGHRVKSITDGTGATMRFEYAATSTTVTNALGAQWTYGYDASGRLTRVVPPVGGETQYDYDADGNVATIIDGAGGRVEMEYDERGNLVLRRDALGNTVRRAYSHHNRLISETSSTLVSASLVDASGAAAAGPAFVKLTGENGVWGQPLRSPDGFAGSATVRFSPSRTDKRVMVGLSMSADVVDSYGAINWAMYCAADGTLIACENGTVVDLGVSYAAGDRLEVTHDGTQVCYRRNGQVLRSIAATSAGLLRVQAAFCDLGAEVRDLRFGSGAAGEFTTRLVQADDNPELLRFEVSAAGRVTEHRYNTYGQRVASLVYADRLHGDGESTSSEAGLVAWVASLEDRSGTRLTEMEYDARGQLRFLHEFEQTDHSGAGVRSTQCTTMFVYDPAGRLVRKLGPAHALDSEANWPSVSYAYDGLGRLLSSTDELGNVTSMLHNDGAGSEMVVLANGATSTTVYDAMGRILGITGVGTTRHTYDAAGNLLMTTDPTGIRTFSLYDGSNRRVATIDGDGTLTRYTYDGAGRVTLRYTHATQIDASLLVDAAGTPLHPALASLIPAASWRDGRLWSIHDEAGRLAFEVDGTGALKRHEYDGVGRLVRTTRYAVALDMRASPDHASVLEQLESAAFKASIGNRVERYFHNADGLLLGCLDADGYLTRYTYDAAGRPVMTRRHAVATAAALRASATLEALSPPQSTQDAVEYDFYDGRGQVIGHVDAERFLTLTQYDARGQATKTIRFARALSVDVTQRSDPVALAESIRTGGLATTDDRVGFRHYDLAGRLVRETSFDGSSTTYAYDAVGNLVASTQGAGDAQSRTRRADYDVWGRCIRESSPEGGEVEHTYDVAGRLASTTDSLGNLTLYFHDLDGRLTHTVNALGEVEEQRHDAFGQLAATIRYATRISLAGLAGGLVTESLTAAVAAVADADIDTKTTYVRDGTGRLVSMRDPEGARTAMTYNAFGELASRTSDIAGSGDSRQTRVDTYTYTGRGLLASSKSDEATSRQTYDAFGRVIRTTDANGRSRTTTYDRLGRIIATANALGMARTTSYDAFDQILTTRDELGAVTAYAYDKAARSVSVTSPEGIVVTTVRNRFGEVYAVTDGNGITTRYSHDRNGNLVQVQVGSTTVARNAYDASGRLLQTIDGRGKSTVYTYDAANRQLTREVDAGGLSLVTRWRYDARGRQVSVTDARGTITTYSYDRRGQTLQQVVDANGLNLVTRYTYDARGQTLTVTDPAGCITRYRYDTLGRRIEETVDAGGLEITRRYSHDANGNVLARIDANGDTTRFTYDAENRLVHVVDPMGSVTRNDYDGAGRLVRETRFFDAIGPTDAPSAAVPDPTRDRVTRYAYDADGRLEYTVDALGTVSQNQYDANGNIIAVRVRATPIGANVAPSAVVTSSADRVNRFVYDAFNRETWRSDATGAVTATAYDAAGNVTRVTRHANLAAGAAPDSVTADAADRITSYTYDGANRRTCTVDGLGYVTLASHDAAGNLTATRRYADRPDSRSTPDSVVADDTLDRVDRFAYDRAGRLVRHVDALGREESYAYDAVGNKVSHTNKNGDTWTYAYDGASRLVRETSPKVVLYRMTRDSATDDLEVASVAQVGVLTTMTYDAMGNLTSRTEADGQPEERTTRYTYDKLGRQVRVDYPKVMAYAESASERDANTGLGAAARNEVQRSPFSVTYYDSLGNAVASTGRNGARSFKVHDAAGRVAFEIDALGCVVGYVRNAFGEVTSLTRYARATSLGETPADVARTLSASTVAGAVDADDERNRTVKTSYDKSGRVVLVSEAAAFTWSATSGYSDAGGARTTRSHYNAFGDLVRISQLKDRTGIDEWIHAYHYYDRGGRQIASVDPLGYVTRREYDSEGNLIKVKEPARALADGSWDFETIGAPAADEVRDRETTFVYDRLNRKVREVRLNVEHSTSSDGSSTRGDLATLYTYDAVGNLIRTRDANGRDTFTYYDALGRVTAVAAPRRNSTVDGEAVVPLVEFRRDAHGNVVVKFERAGGAANATLDGFEAVRQSGDRITKTLYDSTGNALQVDDALGVHHFSSYFGRGGLAKSWMTVTDIDQNKSTLYTSYSYDALGRLVHQYTGRPDGDGSDSIDLEYNAFGEVVRKGSNGGRQEYFEYDNAGRVWRTNSGDGNVKVYLHDLLGRRSAELTNLGPEQEDDRTSDLRNARSAQDAAEWTRLRRTEMQYDDLGRLVSKAGPRRIVMQGGVTVRQAFASATIVASNVPYVVEGENYNSINWSGVRNSVRATWTSLAYLGSGEVRVDLSYLTAVATSVSGTVASPSVARTESQVFRADQADTGATLSWADDTAHDIGGGIGKVTRLVVYKKNVNGDWVKVIDREPGGKPSRPFGTFGSFVEASSPLNPSTRLGFRYRLKGSSDWIDVGLYGMGDSHWFDASTLTAGKTYEYQVFMTPRDEAEELTESGSFVAGQSDVDDRGKTSTWARPVETMTADRWGNVTSHSDPRNPGWRTVYRYNASNQLIEERKPTPYGGNQGSDNPATMLYYDKVGRQVAMRDARGYVSGSVYDTGGNLVQESHADGGRVKHAYDVFGQRVRTIDAVGNASSSDTVRDAHTTLHAYDRLGRLTRTQHGAADAGSFMVWNGDPKLESISSTRRNLVESSAWDEAGRMTIHTDGGGSRTRFWYDMAGHVTKTALPAGQISTATFDSWGHKIREVDANGNDQTWRYDYFGRLVDHKDLDGKDFNYEYDLAGQLIRQTNGRGQDLNFRYDRAGQLVELRDEARNQVSTWAYDLAGHHLREKTVRGGEVLQDNHLAYDTHGRVHQSADNRVRVNFSYDAAGNRTRVLVHTRVDKPGVDDAQTLYDQERYFEYDAMNRQTLVDGDADGEIGSTGHRLTYDLNGNRTSDTFIGNKVTTNTRIVGYSDSDGAFYETGTAISYSTRQGKVAEQYDYDGLNRLKSTERDGIQVDLRRYDGAGRVVQSGPASLPKGYAEALNEGVPADQQIGLELRRQRYDANGRLLLQRVFASNGTTRKYTLDYDGTGRDGTQLGYDRAGNVVGYEFTNHTGDDYTNTTAVKLARFDHYVEASRTTTSTRFERGSSTSRYDANGYLVAVDDATENTLDRSIVNDSAGRALKVVQAGNILYTHIVDGEILGRHGVAPDPVDPRTGGGGARFAQVVDFGFGYRPISAGYPAAAVGAYTVRQGDTLQGIAQAAWGDSRQWWRIAQANGLAGEHDLRVGQTLSIPSAVTGSANASDTFRPYDPGAVVGDTSPNLPQPRSADGGCGGMGQVIMIVVAVAVSIASAGAAAAAMGATTATTTTVSAGMTALAGGYGAAGAAAAAIGGAAGSIAAQAVGMAIGAQRGFSWEQVALGAIGSAVSSGVGGAVGASAASPGGNVLNNLAFRAAATNAATQAIGVGAGLQDRFSWQSVAASGVGAGAGSAVGPVFGEAFGNTAAGQFGARLATGLVAGTAAALARGGSVAVQQIATDAFGNALGNSLAASATNGSYQGQGAAASPYVDPDTGEHIVFGDPYQPDVPEMQQLAGAFGGGSAPPVDRSNDMLLAAGDGFKMGRGPVSIGQRGRTVYITEEGAEPSIDAMLAKARADLRALQRLRDEALTAELNRNSVVRETVTPIFEPITVEVPPVVSEVVGAVGDVATGAIAGLADMTVAPLADLAQTSLKALHGAVTGDYPPLTPLSSYADSVVNRGAGAWEGIKTTGASVFNLSPAGMAYHAGAGGYGLAIAAMNGDVRAATREGLGLGLNFAGAIAVGSMGMARTPSTPSLLVQAETSALQRMAANSRAAAPWADLRQAYQQARGQVDFAHIEADVVLDQVGNLVKAHGGHFPTSPRTNVVRDGTDRWAPNGVGYAKVELLGPDGKWHRKTNNIGDPGFASLTPETWSFARAKGEMAQAWLNRLSDPGGKWTGVSGGVEFRFFPPNKQVPMWRGYPLEP